MDLQAATGNERMLRRVIALLASLAVLAERVADSSLVVRWFVLWILRRAETVASEFVFVETGMPPAIDGIAAVGNGPEDAPRLAARFRALAAALCALLPLGCRFDRRPARRGLASGHFFVSGPGRLPGCWTRKPNDTS